MSGPSSIASTSSPDSIFLQDVFKSKADVLVIPHGTNGQVSWSFEKGVAELTMVNMVPKDASLGNVQIVPIPKAVAKQHKWIAFACTTDGHDSNYAAIRRIGARIPAEILSFTHLTSFTVACPLLGAGSGLNPLYTYRILYAAFTEARSASKSQINFYTDSHEIYSDLNSIEAKSKNNSVQLATFAAIEFEKRNHYIMELTEDEDFYFDLAKLKFDEFKKYDPAHPEFFAELYTEFSGADTTFQEYLRRVSPDSEQFHFLELCGALVAYIDMNAYNKYKWNKYKDQRTLARSSVRQTNWILNLIKFRSDKNDFNVVSSTISNALRFLDNPRENINMLSDNHRSILSKTLFNVDYRETNDLRPIFEVFRKIGFQCKNPMNNGVLISRVLYLPEISELWLDSVVTENTDESIPSEAIPDSHYPEQYADTPPSPIEPTNETSQTRTIEPSIHSDIFSEVSDKDLLNYNAYARSIAQFISHSETKPPLTIGILAPWGKGKTTLMKLIQKNIKELSKNPDTEGAQTAKEVDDTRTTYAQFKSFLRQKTTELIEVKKLKHPTVWFNAWNFQKNEQIWAGFAEEIITQLIAQIPSKLDQEKAWLALNLRRLDRQKIRQRLHAILFKKFIPVAILMLFLVVGIVLSLVLNWNWVKWLPSVSIPLIAAATWGKYLFDKLKIQSLDVDLSKFLKPAEYREKMGYLYGVKEDLKIVLELLVEKDEPAVIFVDDLDRCSPNTTSEIVEAINLFISGDLPHCYFILGQDAQMVAAALDYSYRDVSSKLGNLQSSHGSLGWFFMEKFIQLQFNIPVMRPDDGKRIMKSLLNVIDSKEESVEAKQEHRQELQKKIDVLSDKIKSTDNQNEYIAEVDEVEKELLEVDPEKAKNIRQKVIDKAAASYSDQDSEVVNLIEAFAKDLSTSPRMIKRFVNLYRFYRFIQFTGQNKELMSIEANTIGKWITVMIKWPQLVRAIQWDSEKNFLNGITSVDRANNFEIEMNGYADFDKWQEFAAKKYGSELPWVLDKGLYQFLQTSKEAESSLKNAVETSFW